MRELPSGTITFLFTDIEGSTRLLSELGERYAEALAEHRRVLREAFQRHRGVEVDTQGDAFFYAFGSVGDAVAAAAEGQAALTNGPIRVRIGVHTGEPQRTDEGYVGIDVHRAARICSTAHGGQVVLSEATRALLNGPFSLTDLGLHRLKDLGEAEKLFQLGNRRFPPLRSLNATNLPPQPSPLVGRERELDEVQALVREGQLVTLTGAGGSGKTRLALQVAAELRDEFKDGVFWVPLAALTDPELVLSTIAATVGARDGLVEHIDEKRMLLLLDNLEQILACAPALSELLESCPNLKLLATSRAPLRLSGEREYRVSPLPEQDAVALFRARALQAEPLAVVEEICRRLDGLPLAIELAAARTRVLPPDKLLERLERPLPLLTGGRRDAPERQRTLRATIEWSYELLSLEERQLFSRLAVFVGSFDLEAAEHVCDADLDTLESLLEQSLLRRTEAGRFFYLETIREFTVEMLEESGEAGEIRRRHAEYLLALAESANLFAEAEGPQHHDIVIPEQDNVRAAIEWALMAEDVELALRLAIALENFWVTRNPFEGMRWFERLLERDGDVLPVIRARALRAYGGSSQVAGDHERAERLYEESLAEFRALNDSRGISILLFRLGLNALHFGDTGRARPLLDESLELFRRDGSRRGETQALGALGSLERAEGNTDLAVALFEQSASKSAEIGRIWWQSEMLANLAELALEKGRSDEAAARARQALALARRIEDRQAIVYALALLACAAAEAGDGRLAGCLWGTVEAEEARAPVGRWEGERDRYEELVLAHADPDFERGRQQGWNLSVWEAAEGALEVEVGGA